MAKKPPAVPAPEGAAGNQKSRKRYQDFAKALPRANTEFGAFTRIGLITC